MTRQFAEDLPSAMTWIRDRLTAQIRRALEALAYTQIVATVGVTTATGAPDRDRRTPAGCPSGQGFRGVNVRSPADVVTQTLATTDIGAWLGSPSVSLPTIVPSPAVTAGSVIGIGPTAATLLVRDNTRILVADQHGDLFLRNTLVILAECRAATAVLLPSGVGLGTITVVP